MTREEMNHLSEEALNDVLIGMASSASELHLAACTACRAKVEGFHADLGAWNGATLAWSQDRAQHGESIRIPVPHRRLPLAALGWALASAALLAIAIPAGRESGIFGTNHGAAAVAPQQDSETQIAQDNELLKAVNAAINPDEMPQLKEYDLFKRPHPQPRHRPQ
jgi:hypothetical protein